MLGTSPWVSIHTFERNFCFMKYTCFSCDADIIVVKTKDHITIKSFLGSGIIFKNGHS